MDGASWPEWKRVNLATSAAVGPIVTPQALPSQYRGRLSRFRLADLAWCANTYPGESGFGYWPVFRSADPIGAHQTAGPEVETIDAAAKKITVRTTAVDLPIATIRAALVAIVKDAGRTLILNALVKGDPGELAAVEVANVNAKLRAIRIAARDGIVAINAAADKAAAVSAFQAISWPANGG